MRKFMAMIISGLLVVNSIPAWASETKTDQKIAVQGESRTISNGMKYGVVPTSWKEKLDKEVTKEDLQTLYKAVEAKIGSIKQIKKQTEQNTFKATEGQSQKAVMEQLYQVVSKFDYKFDDEIEKKTGIDYLKALGVVEQDVKEAELEQKCTYEDAAVLATKIIDKIYEGEDAGSKGFLWKVQKGGNTVYMLGSIHVANNSIYPFSKDIMEAYEKADTLGVEVRLSDQEGLQAFAKSQVYLDNSVLKDHISKGLYEKVMKAVKKLGVNEKDIEVYKPWALANTFTTLASTSGKNNVSTAEAVDLGIDNYFMQIAENEKKPISELEGYKEQGALFDHFSDKLQEYYLNSSLEAFNSEGNANTTEDEGESVAAQMVGSWLTQWKDGNLKDFSDSYVPQKELVDKEHPEEIKEYNNVFFVERDKKMSEKVEKWLNQGGNHTTFVVAGSGHFVGKTGIVALLEAKGYQVTQIK